MNRIHCACCDKMKAPFIATALLINKKSKQMYPCNLCANCAAKWATLPAFYKAKIGEYVAANMKRYGSVRIDASRPGFVDRMLQTPEIRELAKSLDRSGELYGPFASDFEAF